MRHHLKKRKVIITIGFLRQKKCPVNENVYNYAFYPGEDKDVEQYGVVSSECVKRTGEKATPNRSAMKYICRIESGPQ